jgi:Tol biopolymer transport system component
MSVDLETQLRSYRRNFDIEAPAVVVPERSDESLVMVDVKPPTRRGWRPRPGLAVAMAMALLVVIVVGGVGLVLGPVASEPDPTGVPTNGWIAFSVLQDPKAEAEDMDIWLVALDEEPRRVIGTDADTVDELCPAFSPDGRRLAYARLDGQGAALAVADVDAEGRASDPVIIDGGDGLPPPCPVWSPDGSQIAVGVPRTSPVNSTTTAAGSEVRIITLSDNRVTVLPDLLAMDLEWSPDGTMLAVVSGVDGLDQSGGNMLHDGRIYVYAPASGTIRPIDATLGATRMTWSPDGERIAYQRIADPTGDSYYELLVIDIETGQQDLVDTYGAIHGIGPVWSPDGEWIAYQRCAGGSRCNGEKHEVVLVPGIDSQDGAEGAAEIVIDSFLPPHLYPWWVTWSPDSQYLLYRAFEDSLAAVPISRGHQAVVVAEDSGMLAYDGFDRSSTFVPIQSWGIRGAD